MLIEDDVKLDYSDVLIRPKRSTLSSRREVELEKTYTFKHSGYNFTGIPIMTSNMEGVGTIEMFKEFSKHGLFTCLHKFYNDKPSLLENIIVSQPLISLSIGCNRKELDWFKDFITGIASKSSHRINYICMDVANGYQESFVGAIEEIRNYCPEVTIIAGNVVTADMTTELILKGADIVKIGIGPGSVCTTRLQTGVGYPQLSAVIECADAAHALGGHIIADGGCVYPGDVAKAFGSGADFVMLGGMLAGHDEGGADKIYDRNDPKTKIEFSGMASRTIINKYQGGLKDYRSSEGKTVKIPYKGKVKNTIQEILGGLRSACTYVGARRLKDLPKCTTFIRVNNTHNKVYE